ncbi:F0F1 ATP synthase subunit epsilon [Rickettsia bellii OSU 85-389]|nr:F0F1 ATP synthase subunit epsilon [Rickettsia bellii OSU 85-389]
MTAYTYNLILKRRFLKQINADVGDIYIDF